MGQPGHHAVGPGHHVGGVDLFGRDGRLAGHVVVRRAPRSSSRARAHHPLRPRRGRAPSPAGRLGDPLRQHHASQVRVVVPAPSRAGNRWPQPLVGGPPGGPRASGSPAVSSRAVADATSAAATRQPGWSPPSSRSSAGPGWRPARRSCRRSRPAGRPTRSTPAPRVIARCSRRADARSSTQPPLATGAGSDCSGRSTAMSVGDPLGEDQPLQQRVARPAGWRRARRCRPPRRRRTGRGSWCGRAGRCGRRREA